MRVRSLLATWVAGRDTEEGVRNLLTTQVVSCGPEGSSLGEGVRGPSTMIGPSPSATVLRRDMCAGRYSNFVGELARQGQARARRPPPETRLPLPRCPGYPPGGR